MGREAECEIRVDGKSARGKAHLESTTLRVSGDVPLKLALGDLRGVSARDGVLSFGAPVGAVELDLGPAAEQWAHAILNPKSRLEKIGVEPAHSVCAIEVRDAGFARELSARLTRAPADALRGSFDLIFRGIDAERDLREIERCAAHLVPDGALWLIHQKGKGAAVGENAVRTALLSAGLVDTKVVAFSATHTATKAVIPLKARAR
jgi:hypothetical protein